jgi:HEPN domain-containing protein
MVESIDPNAWLKLADEEFNYALSDLEDDDQTFFAPTCFHFQQVAEKYLKAYILACGKTFRKIHNLVELVKICATEDPDFSNLLKDTATLNPFYTDTRYPVHWPMDFTRQDAEKAKKSAQRIRDFVKEKISSKI